MKPALGLSRLVMALLLWLIPNAMASTTWYVDGLNGNDSNSCTSATTACKTIGHAISLASGGDAIKVAASTYAENFYIGTTLNIVGAGAKGTIIGTPGTSVVTIYGATSRVTISNVTISNGSGVEGGGISNSGILTIKNSIVSGNNATPLLTGGGLGGGIYNTGTLTIDHTEISGNSSRSSHACRICFARGGAIYNAANSSAIINDSTLNSNNTVTSGGGIDNEGVLAINNSTITGNSTETSAGGAGGGVYNAGTVTISNSTITENSSPFAGNIYFGGSTTLQNSIVANSPNGNCGGITTSNGYNLSSDDTCNFGGPGDLNNTDPMLGPLQNNGGPTQTQALLPGSPAIDAGNPSGCTDGQGGLLKTDQRGKPRPDPQDIGGCDMGAYESQTD